MRKGGMADPTEQAETEAIRLPGAGVPAFFPLSARGEVRRNITQAAFTIFRRNVPAHAGLYRSGSLSNFHACEFSSRWKAAFPGGRSGRLLA
jgi:hypothetical protein